MANIKEDTGLQCLRSIAANLRASVNFDAMLDSETLENYAADPASVLFSIASRLEMDPEMRKFENEDSFGSYRGAVLFKLKSGVWICAVDAGQLKTDRITVYDPTAKTQGGIIQVAKANLLELVTGEAIIFRSLQGADNRAQSALFAVAMIGKHHGLPLDVKRLMHEYAVGAEEVSPHLLDKIISDNGMKCKHVKLDWEKLFQLGQAYPVIGRKRNGKYLIICGAREVKDGDEVKRSIAILDPNIEMQLGQQFVFWGQEDFERECSGECILLKRRYSLTDEKRPFGLLWFLPEFLKLKGIFGQIAMAVLMTTVVALITPLFFQIVVDKVLPNQSEQTLNVLGVAIMAALLFNAGMEFLRSYLLLFATNKIDISTAIKTFSHLMRLPLDFFERVPSGVLLKHMQQTERIRGFLSGNLFFTILELFSLVVFVPFLLLYSWELTLIVLAYSVVMAVVIALLIKPFQRRLHELYQAEGKRQSMLVEAIHGIRTVKSLAVEPVEEKSWNDTTAYAITSYFRVGKISITAKSISQFLEMAMVVTVIWAGTLMVFSGDLSIGALIAFQMLSGRVTGPLVKLVGLIHEYQQIAISVKMLGVVMNTRPEHMGGGVRTPIRGRITFENVSFRYAPELPMVIKDFDLDIQPGQVIGIVGRSGSGKTTLTKLLQGLYPLNQGVIKIDNVDLREIDKVHLRSGIGVVLQENYFFSGTVRENLSLTKKSATLEEIIYASKLAGADEFVQNLPKGYDTMLEENASNLSGGQKQRLAIARALLTNPPILIFDEATSALDPESENVIQENLAAIAKGRTVLIISHRLSIVSGANKILVLDKGEKTDFASHQELLSRDGVYNEFWKQQMERHMRRQPSPTLGTISAGTGKAGYSLK